MLDRSLSKATEIWADLGRTYTRTSKHLITAGFNTFQGTPLHALFNFRGKILMWHPPWYLSFIQSLLPCMMSQAHPQSCRYSTTFQQKTTTCYQVPACPCPTQVHRLPRLSPAHYLSQLRPTLAVDWEPRPISRWKPEVTKSKGQVRMSHWIIHPRPIGLSSELLAFKAFVTFSMCINHYQICLISSDL